MVAVPGSTLLQLLSRQDGHPAVVEPDTGLRLDYGQLHHAVHDARRQLAGLGVTAGSRVALAFPNRISMLVCFLAVASSGAAAAPLNPQLTAAELGREVADLEVAWLLGDDAAAGRLAGATGSGVAVHVAAVRDGRLRIDGAGASSADGHDSPDSVALLLRTSGTTSRPKTVPLRQRNLVASARTVAATYRLTDADVSLCVMPLFHVHGLVAAALATLASGGTVVLPPRFRASSFWTDAVRTAATWYTAVPTIHAFVLAGAAETPAGAVGHRLRFVRSCSAPLPVPLWQRYEETLRVPLVEAYGMTEAAHQMTANPLPPGQRRPGSVGRATGVQLAVLDDSWEPVPGGAPGEVAVRGPSVVDGYLGNPQANAASFRDGWFRTGDVGTLSADGYLTLVGRLKELINRGGEKISPYEVEGVLLTHPAVAEAAAYPLPDPDYGEQVAAVVVLREPATTAELLGHCAAALAPFKVPRSLTVTAEIPKGPTGKVQRRLLADLLRGGTAG